MAFVWTIRHLSKPLLFHYRTGHKSLFVELEGNLSLSKYCSEAKCNANLASAALNEWLKPIVADGCVIHSFWHSLRDRIRVLECPANIINAIGGWTTEGVGHQYGRGHTLTVMHGWMERLAFAATE